MADVTLTYKGNTILELSADGTKAIKTAGKYCEADILLIYTGGGGGSGRCPRAEGIGLFYADPFVTANPMGGIITVESPAE